MKPNAQKTLGAILILTGIVLILNSFSGITGFVVAESLGKSVSSILGLVFVIGGVLVFMSGRSLSEILSDATKTAYGTLKMRDTPDALRYTDLKVKERYEEEKPIKKSNYQKFLDKNSYFDNEASKYLFRNHIPNSSKEMVKIAKKCPYDIFPKEGDGIRVKNSEGDIITELGSHSENSKDTQRGRLKAMARGRSSWRT